MRGAWGGVHFTDRVVLFVLALPAAAAAAVLGPPDTPYADHYFTLKFTVRIARAHREQLARLASPMLLLSCLRCALTVVVPPPCCVVLRCSGSQAISSRASESGVRHQAVPSERALQGRIDNEQTMSARSSKAPGASNDEQRATSVTYIELTAVCVHFSLVRFASMCSRMRGRPCQSTAAAPAATLGSDSLSSFFAVVDCVVSRASVGRWSRRVAPSSLCWALRTPLHRSTATFRTCIEREMWKEQPTSFACTSSITAARQCHPSRRSRRRDSRNRASHTPRPSLAFACQHKCSSRTLQKQPQILHFNMQASIRVILRADKQGEGMKSKVHERNL